MSSSTRPSGQSRPAIDVRQRGLQHDGPRLDVDGPSVEAREVEQLLEQPPQALALLDADAEQLLPQLLTQLRPAIAQAS